MATKGKMHFVFFMIIGCVVADNPEVKTPVGTIIGAVREAKFSNTSKPVTQFLGIPYAEPPTGQLRFTKPVPKEAFENSFNASAHGPACPQNMFANPDQNLTNQIQEDCLNLNVYVPGSMKQGTMSLRNRNEAGNFPVMIWFHGGGFIIGTSNYYDGSIISAYNDVIVVTVNYRLSVFGFLSTGDSTSPGNYGLWDQHLAIKWVNNNIAAFGGDVNKITIAGESAGSASVFYHATYPGNKGLFQRIIGESGVTMSTWAVTDSEEIIQHNLEYYAKQVNCSLTDKATFLTCLRNKNVEELMLALKVTEPIIELGVRFSPVVDGDFVSKSPKVLFSGLNTAPELEMFQSVDILTGVNNMDGSLYTLGVWNAVVEATTHTSINEGCPKPIFDNVIVPHVTKGLFNKVSAAVDNAIAFEYTDWIDSENVSKTRGNILNMSSDFTFIVPAIKSLNKHFDINAGKANGTSRFFYRFSQRPSYSPYPPWVTGAAHADELGYVFGFPPGLSRAGGIPVVPPPTPAEEELSSYMMVYWTNFIKSGDPNFPVKLSSIQWPLYDNTTQSYIDFNLHLSPASVHSKLIPQRDAFWEVYIPKVLQANEVDFVSLY